MYDPLRDTRVAKATAQEPLGDIQLLPAFTLEQAKIKSNVPQSYQALAFYESRKMTRANLDDLANTFSDKRLT